MATLPATLQVDDVTTSPGAGGGAVSRADTISYKLENVSAPSGDRTLNFTPATDVAIGRDKTTCQLAYPECGVLSRTHCRIFSMGRDVFVHDFSSNGTFLNGRKMGKGNKSILRSGDVIAVVNPNDKPSNDPATRLFSWKFVPPADEEVAESLGLTGSYTLGKVLGTGNFATVKLGVSKHTQQRVAVKIIEKKRFALQNDFSFSSLQHEVDILRKMNHKNIIHIHDVYDDSNHFTMVLELVPNGDLFDYVVGRSPQPFSEKEAKHLFIQLIEALLYMHSKDVVHRDLKPENILVSVDPSYKYHDSGDNQRNSKHIPVDKVTLKITDFGLAKFCANNQVMTTMCGTPAYLAPEVLQPSKTTSKKAAGYGWGVDVWSLGCILYILLSGCPVQNPQAGKISFNKFFNNVSQHAKELVIGMLRVDPAHRFGLSDIVNHPWFKGCIIDGKELAIETPKIEIAPTMMLSVAATVGVTPSLEGGTTFGGAAPAVGKGAAEDGKGGDTDQEGSDDDDIPDASSRSKRLREAEETMEKIVWSWKSDLKKDDSDPTAWTMYNEAESAAIEKAKEKGYRSCRTKEGSEYRISFEGMFQYNKLDTSKQRPVKRDVVKSKSGSA